MKFPARSVQVFRCSLLAAFCTTVCGVQLATAQSPKSESSDDRPSRYEYPLRTWVQPEPHRGNGGVRDPRSATTVTGPQSANTAIIGKLQSIVIPHVEFRKTSLLDAIEYLRQESRRLDPDPDPDNRGVNIFLKLPKPLPRLDHPVEPTIPGLPLSTEPSGSPQPPVAGADQTSISLTMDRLPLLEALRYVARQAGMKIRVEEYAVSVVPLTSTIPVLVTAEYRVLLVSLGGSIVLRPPPPEDDQSFGTVTRGCGFEKSWLESLGISFPSASSATYLPRSHRLIVRNTQENLDKVAALISSALEPPGPTPANP